ncbi:hypothetical protein BC936DRAFT_140263 [Jimgerdemannia flammicorona]|uniref:Uncharacterized protein n=1 Tax=Jimgerdemannia flammicorona TaxID=994334 RepID=A0A433AVP0_9FUNG|nr:hypothetical protein BC936DRAFT_140263 [Jimgerdemannia flammicorona]
MLRALEIARDTRCKKNVIWETAYCNIGHLYRRMGRYDEALSYFEKVLVLNPQNASAYAAIGWIRQLRGETDEAIVCYHQALSLNPSDTYATEMLQHALDDLKHRPLFPSLPDEFQNGNMSDDDELAAEFYNGQQQGVSTSSTAVSGIFAMRQPFGGYLPGGAQRYTGNVAGSAVGMDEDGLYHDEEDDQAEMDIYEDEDEVDQGLGSGNVSFG